MSRNIQKKLPITILLTAVVAFATPTHADPITLTGTINFPEQGTVYLQLVDQAAFEAELDGEHIAIINEPISPAPYVIEDIDAGNYMVRAFQDTNNNGELDMGLFGPKEPWLILGYKPSAFKRPNFQEHSISIDADMNLQLELIP